MNMNTINLAVNDQSLSTLKKDAQTTQKRGLPFIMASVVIWSLIFLLQFWAKPIITINFYTFMCSSFLMPLAFGFSKIVKADIFKKTNNPVSKLGFLCTMNQMLYLCIVMWAFSKSPESMMMLYAMVFGAHLFPYAWVYDSRAYGIFAIADTIGVLLICNAFGNAAAAAFMVVMQIALSLLLLLETRKDSKDN